MDDLFRADDGLAVAVADTLDAVYAQAPPGRRHEFAFNVLLNALSSVLEAIREEEPSARAAYAEMAAVVLRDD